jgi:hypothetical protein
LNISWQSSQHQSPAGQFYFQTAVFPAEHRMLSQLYSYPDFGKNEVKMEKQALKIEIRATLVVYLEIPKFW